MRKAVWLVLVAALVLIVLGGCKQPAPSTATTAPAGPMKVKLYVPCGMIIPVRAVMEAFEVQHPNVKVEGIFDNPGIIVDRLTKKGEKADLVITPGSVEMDLLKASGIMAPDDPKAIGDFELVVIVPVKSKLDLKTPADLKKCKTIGSADSETNSTGVTGRLALTKLGLWDALKPKMVFTKHAIDAYTMVSSGKADAAVCYKNCPLDTNPEKLSKSKVRVAFSFPATSYTKPQCLIARTGQGNMMPAQQFLEYITSEEGLKILSENGMTGCLDLAGGACAVTPDTAAKPAADATPKAAAAVKVVAYYPDNNRHAAIKRLVLGLPAKYPGVAAEFVDFTTDEGFKVWQAAGMTCGGIQINGEQTWTYDKAGTPTEVTFKMALDGEWTAADLEAVVKKALADKGQQ